MVGKVIDNGDAIPLCLHFESAFYALESLQRGGDCLFRDSTRDGERRCGGGIPDVVFSSQGKFESCPRLPFLHDRPCCTGGFEPQVWDFPVGTLTGAIALDGAAGFG